MRDLGLDEDKLLRGEDPLVDSEMERLEELSLGEPSADDDALSDSLLGESYIQSEWH